jgi:hypothetical protein
MTNEETLKWFKDDLKNGKCSDERRQCNAMDNFYDYDIEVIGNIYDNPELLEGDGSA